MSSDYEQRANIQEYQEKLLQVQELLRDKPTDVELLKLQRDLQQYLQLQQDLLAVQPSNAQSRAQQDAGESNWPPGKRCQALYEDGKWYIARIEEQTASGNYRVTYLAYGDVYEVPESSLKPYQPAPEGHLTSGVKVQAIWSDGLFYDGVISAVVDRGTYRVKFSKVKKQKLVAAYDIILAEDNTLKKPGELEDLPDKFEVPEFLVPRPSDTEQEKQAKRKAIKREKNKLRLAKVELAGIKRQNEWQTFQKKVQKKTKRKMNSSQFKSPDAVSGKVGVVRSGQGMTEYKMAGKHDFSHLTGEPSPSPSPSPLSSSASSSAPLLPHPQSAPHLQPLIAYSAYGGPPPHGQMPYGFSAAHDASSKSVTGSTASRWGGF